MVRVFAAQIVDMQRDQGVIDEALEKLASQVHIELADVRARERNMVVQAWPAGKTDDDPRQCFVQRQLRMAVAAPSGLELGTASVREGVGPDGDYPGGPGN